MFSFILDLCSVAVGVIIPIFRTWRVLRSKRATALVPLAKYWIVFGIWITCDTVANLLYLTYFIPFYSLAKFVMLLYMSIGYEHLYQKTISPFLRKYEPNMIHFFTLFTAKVVQLAITCGSLAVKSCTNYLDITQAQQNPLEIMDMDLSNEDEREADLTMDGTIIGHEEQSEEAMDAGRERIRIEMNAEPGPNQIVREHSLDSTGTRDGLKALKHCSCGGECSNRRCSCFKSGLKCNNLCHKNVGMPAACLNK